MLDILLEYKRSFIQHVNSESLQTFRQKNNSSRDEIHEKKSMINLDRLQKTYTNCKGAKTNTNFGQITGIQEKLYTACKQDAL
jgi:endonuclease I